jgi:hypothetical protein
LASRAAAPTRFNCVGAPFATASSNVPAIGVLHRPCPDPDAVRDSVIKRAGDPRSATPTEHDRRHFGFCGKA